MFKAFLGYRGRPCFQNQKCTHTHTPNMRGGGGGTWVTWTPGYQLKRVTDILLRPCMAVGQGCLWRGMNAWVGIDEGKWSQAKEQSRPGSRGRPLVSRMSAAASCTQPGSARPTELLKCLCTCFREKEPMIKSSHTSEGRRNKGS